MGHLLCAAVPGAEDTAGQGRQRFLLLFGGFFEGGVGELFWF